MEKDHNTVLKVYKNGLTYYQLAKEFGGNKQEYVKLFEYYETEEDKAQEKFVELMNDVSIGEYRMMTIETLSEILEEGCRVLD